MMKIISITSIVLAFAALAFAQDTSTENSTENRPLRLLFRPPALYTEIAKNDGVEGEIRLRITFKADRTIGQTLMINEDNEEKATLVRYGLAESALKAARQIRFEPQIKEGKAVDTMRVVVYSFRIE